MSTVFVRVSVSRDVMRNVLVYWSNVLARFMSWAIAGGRTHRIVRRESFVIG
jgi:hypothetical protein